MYNPHDDVVLLDGMNPSRNWPVELAEQLLADPTPLSRGYFDSGLTQWSRFAEVASCVNWHNRLLVSPKLSVTRLLQNESLEVYSTQELLDMLRQCGVCNITLALDSHRSNPA